MLAVAAEPRTCPPAVVEPLVAILQQVADLVGALSDEQYVRKPVGGVVSSVGGHVRHCLDHVDTLLHGIDRGELDYDQRQRGTDVENCRQAALLAIRRQQRHLRYLPEDVATQTLQLTAVVTPGGDPVVAETSVGRELVFVLSHTIHHNSLLAVMAKALGAALPPYFGYAPSTIAYREAVACVR